MKILHIHLDPPGNLYGTGNFYRKISESLNKKNIFGTNICCNRYVADTFYQSNIIFATKRIKKRFPLITYLYEVIALEIKSFLFLIKNKKNYDLIIAYNDCGILLFILSKFYKIKYIKFFFHLHKSYVNEFYKEKYFYEKKLNNKFLIKKSIADFLIYIEDCLRIAIDNYFLNKVDLFFTCLKDTKKEILNYRKKIKKKNTTIKVFTILYEKKINIKKKHNHKKNILMVASSLYQKGFTRFLEILTIDNFKLTKIYNVKIIGLTNLNLAEKYLKLFKLEDKIKIYGFVGKEINKFYKESDIFVNLSLIEGWNMAITDAYLSKKIIVSSKVGCINEIFKKNINVFSQNRLDNNNFFKKLIKINYNNIQFRVDKQFNLLKKLLHNESVINDYIHFFESILKKKP
jgi:glycosyltransferase involved in cell wall biosynthesis